MKKFILALCLCTLSLCAWAQQNQNRQFRGPRRATDAVVDTAIMNKMEIAPEMMALILNLQQTKQEQMKAEMTQSRGRGTRMSDEERQALADRRQTFSKIYRAELRAIMGDELYITYLEKMLDNRQMPAAGFRPGMDGGQGRQRQMMGPGQMQMGAPMDGNDF